MIDISKIDYSKFDRPEILMRVFHPRPELHVSRYSTAPYEVLIPVAKEVSVGARFHMVGQSLPNILFFHGNGEIVADYDDIADMYRQMGLNFMPVDYRGYGRSSGRPTITSMMRDAHVILLYALSWLAREGYRGPLIVMGRSLGSASALEISAHYENDIDGLIIESGFAHARPLLLILGIDMNDLNIREEEGFRNIEKIRGFEKATLIIHAENDHIIPFREGQILYDVCGAEDKMLLKIAGANHNDIFFHGMSEYMEAVRDLAEKTKDAEGRGSKGS
jgi:alpha-beta hydrolase superfamily lysophospholipase